MTGTNRLFFITLCSVGLFTLSACAPAEGCLVNAKTQFEMNQCAKQQAITTDTELKSVYQKLSEKTDAEGQVRLQTAQEAWVTYRTKECKFKNRRTADGSVHPMVISYCYTNMTQERIKTLQAQLDCEEGHLACTKQ
ncbi:MAG: lysozyme inhibitor LprI family protein [Alphaproteobacteria bacterium]|nr:lysozyme inhibitor LprI family protein [Alphaproteobacteria bacterium]